MSGEDQERFEDYLELEEHIEKLQAGQVAHPPAELTPEQARIYRMASLFHAASPDATTIRPEFAQDLQTRLEQELQQPQQPQQAQNTPPGKAKKEQGRPKQLPRLSRRALITGSAATAAALTIGAAIDHLVEHSPGITDQTGTTTSPEQLIPPNANTAWHFVTTLAALGTGATRFTTNTLVGYVLRDETNVNQVIAMSAACTHMGCIVQWQDSDRKFHCPCHEGLFTASGQADNERYSIRYLNPLPRLRTKIEQGNVYVEVPVSK